MTESALIAAIRDEPDDDLPRLAYADWCEEEGRAERAEFIRVQIELARGVRDRGRAAELLRRLRDLSIEYRAAWMGALRELVPGATFERGFITEVTLSAREFLASGEEILAAHPITSLVLTHADAGRAAELATAPSLAVVRRLDLHESGLGDNEVRALARSPHLGRLRSLDLRRNRAGRKALPALASSPTLRELSHLNLAGNDCGNPAVVSFALALTLPALTRLDLSNNRLGPAAARRLAGCQGLRSLRALRLAGNDFSARDIELLARSPHLTDLQVLDVCNFGGYGQAGEALRREFGPRLVC